MLPSQWLKCSHVQKSVRLSLRLGLDLHQCYQEELANYCPSFSPVWWEHEDHLVVASAAPARGSGSGGHGSGSGAATGWQMSAKISLPHGGHWSLEPLSGSEREKLIKSVNNLSLSGKIKYFLFKEIDL